jgi:hypothetical protein|tara:strand:- start:289 stop:1116 length:828 start_codon:yes stop_codon:yes gene_type:complete
MEDKMQIKVTNHCFSMNEMLKNNIDFLIKAVSKGWDGILLFDGVEGSGKTTLASEVSSYEAYQSKRKFDLSHVVFTAEQFNEAVNNSPPGSAILWDEAVFGALGVEWASIVNRTITKLMVTIRKKRLFINIVIPWIYMLQPYLAVGRTRALIHVMTPDGISRGYFRFYDYTGKQQLYFRNKKFFTYYGVKEAFKGTFPQADNIFYNDKEYQKKKDEAISSIMEKSAKGSKYQQALDQRDIVVRLCGQYMKAKDIAEQIGITKLQVHKIIKGDRSS